MKLLVLTAIIAAVATSPLLEEQKWPWLVGKVYTYDVESSTWTKFDNGESNGNSFKTQFEVVVKAPGKLLAKLVNPQYAPLKAQISGYDIPSDLKYETVKDLDQTFEIYVDGGRVVSFKVPSSITNNQENLLKGLISALQVDVSTLGHVDDFPNSFDKESFQGLFKKWETDVTGYCNTLYSVSPASAEWRREFPEFASEEYPVEIVKSKNYDSCKNRVGQKKDFIDYTTEARFFVGKQGTIYMSQVLSSVSASPLITGEQKAEVTSYVQFNLKSIEEDNGTEWQKAKEYRSVDSLQFVIDQTFTAFTYGDEQNVAKAQKILQEITPLLQDPNTLPKSDFLLKFQLLALILRSLNLEQFNQLSSSIDIAKSSKNAAKYGMWIIYRDAVAEAGTPQAFAQIKSWVSSKKIEGQEAAQVITAFGAALAHPQKALLVDFFNFTTSPEVTEQRAISNSAFLAITKLLRYAGQDEFVIKTVIPYFSEQLKIAVRNSQTSKAQVFVRVLGNLAYPQILEVFAPYMEGKVPVSKYLRIQLVTSLKTLANLRDPYTRAALFSILKNTAEPYEVRVAAALNIFLSFPTAEMFQVLAHITNDDPSIQVRSVVASGITFAAALKDPQFAVLAERAQAVLDIVTKVKYGYRYSTDSIIDGYTDEDEFSFIRELSYIGSKDNILPTYHRSALRFKNTDLNDERQVTLSVSDVQDLIAYFVDKFLEGKKVDVDFKFSAKQIVEALKIKRASKEPLEGALFLENSGQQKLVTFSEDELSEFVANLIINLEDNLASGYDFQYTKILTTKKETILLPLASGVPFMFSYSQPFAIIAKIQTKMLLDKASKTAENRVLETKVDITVARNYDGSVGYVDTIKETLVVAGVINRLQVHLPAKISTTFDIHGYLKLKFEPLQTEKDVKLFHYSVWPYNAKHIKDLITYDLEVIKRPKIVRQLKETVGQWTNMFYQLKGYTYSSDFADFKLFTADLLTNIGNLFYQKDIAFTEFESTYLNKESTTKSVTFSVYCGALFNQNNEGNLGRAALPKNKDADSVARREELVKKVTTGIKSAEVRILDLSAKFDAVKKIEYSFTSAIAYSYIDPKFQAGFFAHGTEEEFSALIQVDKRDTKIVPLNFEEALKNKINIGYVIDVVRHTNTSVRVEGHGTRSDEYTEELRNDPKAKSCLQDVSKKNFYQEDCYKLIIKAHAPDLFKLNMKLENFGHTDWALSNRIFVYFKNQYLEPVYSIPLKTYEENSVGIGVKADYYKNYVQYTFASKYGESALRSQGIGYYPYAWAVYGPITSYERIRNWFTGHQAWPYCAIDDSKVRTLSGRSYAYSLTSSWHLVMLNEADNIADWNDLVILARRPSANQEEVYVSYKSKEGKYLELEIKPDSVKVNTNSVKTLEGPLTLYYDEDTKIPLLEYYTLAEGIQVFNIRNGAYRIVYDKQRLVIFTDENRSTTRGVCGQSTGEVGDDYLTPFGLVDQPALYGASFTLEGEYSDAKTAELKKEAKAKAYQSVPKYTKILHSDAEWSKVFNKSIKS